MPHPFLPTGCAVLLLSMFCPIAASQDGAPPPEAAPVAQLDGGPSDTDADGEEGKASTLLVPRFEVGQRVVLRQLNHDADGAAEAIGTIVHLDVLERNGADLVLRWAEVKKEAPSTMAAADREAWEEAARTLLPAPIELVVTDGVGLTGLRDWEKARDNEIAHCEKMRDNVPLGSESFLRLKMVVKIVREAMATKEGTEEALVGRREPFFKGLCQPIRPGEEISDVVEKSAPFGDAELTMRMQRMRRCAVDPQNPDLVTIETHLTQSPEDAKAFMEAVTAQMGRVLAHDAPDPGLFESSTEMTWTFNQRIGWPVAVHRVWKNRLFGEESVEVSTWTLIEGPVMIDLAAEDQDEEAELGAP